jgi:hypothetical protein
MSTSQEKIALGDAADRERAVATFDRNIVVTAGAGTGKRPCSLTGSYAARNLTH